MLMIWARWLPYWVVVWINRRQFNVDGQANLDFGTEKLLVSYSRMGAGEFVVYSQELQDKYDKREKLKRDKKLNDKLDKINKQLDGDYWLKKELEDQFERDKIDEEY